MSLPYGSRSLEAVLFDLDDVLVPFQTPAAWQWAWRPQGPLLGDRRVRSAVRHALRAWDRRRWDGLTGRQPPADGEALRSHLGATLTAIAGHPVAETEAVVRRFLHPAGEVERYPDVAPALDRLRALSVKVGVVTPLPAESARWLTRRCGLPDSLVLGAGDGPGPIVPDAKAFRAGAEALGVPPEQVGYVGDLFWSDVRAAARAGLAPLLLDRREGWPHVQVGRIVDLAGLEAAFAVGDSATDADGSAPA